MRRLGICWFSDQSQRRADFGLLRIPTLPQSDTPDYRQHSNDPQYHQNLEREQRDQASNDSPQILDEKQSAQTLGLPVLLQLLPDKRILLRSANASAFEYHSAAPDSNGKDIKNGQKARQQTVYGPRAQYPWAFSRKHAAAIFVIF